MKITVRCANSSTGINTQQLTVIVINKSNLFREGSRIQRRDFSLVQLTHLKCLGVDGNRINESRLLACGVTDSRLNGRLLFKAVSVTVSCMGGQ